jgi:succinyl-diaminopimelate desuccinylase
VNASIHKVDERVALAELNALPELFREMAERLLASD